MNPIQITARVSGFVAMILMCAACSKVQFAPGDNTGLNSTSGLPGTGGNTGGGTGGTGSSCSGSLGTTHRLTKMLFVIDMSGSNQSAAGCTLSASCTDPNKTMRAGSIQKFFNDYGSKSNFAWAFNIFQGTTSSALVNSGSASSPIFGNATQMQNAINTFEGMQDLDSTPYGAALQLATSAIQNDPDLNSVSSPQYLVVFMSDGQPTDNNATTILSEVQTLMNLAPGRISFNAVYYGTGDAAAASLIQSMAQLGHGNFLNTYLNPSGLDFQISDLVKVPCP